MLLSDCSDAPQRMGAEESQVYKSLRWATSVQLSFKQGLDSTLKEVQSLITAINGLPSSGVPGQLKSGVSEELNIFSEQIKKSDFYEHNADFNSTLTTLKNCINSSVDILQAEQEQRVEMAQSEAASQIDWNELTVDEKELELKRFENLVNEASKDIHGLKQLISQEYNIAQKLIEVNKSVSQKAQTKRAHRVAEEKAKYEKNGKVKVERKVTIPKLVTQKAELEQLIQLLQQLKGDLELNGDIEIHLDFEI
jgi:hypothetical protein